MPTTKTIKSSGGDYTSLTAWEAALPADITGLGVYEASYQVSTTERVTLNGTVTTASDYIRIFTPPGSRHDGTFGTGCILTDDSTDGRAIGIADNFVRIEGMAVVCTVNGVGSPISDVGISGTSDIRVEYTIVKSTLSPISTQAAVALNFNNSSSSLTLRVKNCAVWDFGAGGSSGGYGLGMLSYTGTAYINNNTFYGCRFGMVIGGTNQLIFNNICDTNSSGDYNGTPNASSATNLSSDTTSPNAAFRSKNPVYVNEASRNLKLDTTDTDAKDKGTDLSAATYPVADDVIGTARPQNSVYDIGFSEVISGGGGGPTPFFSTIAMMGVG